VAGVESAAELSLRRLRVEPAPPCVDGAAARRASIPEDDEA